MSAFTHSHTKVAPPRTRLLSLIALLIATAAVLALVALARTGGDSPRSHASVTPVAETSGPNEAARGVSVATAAGGPPPVQAGGADESARGIAAASASRASSPCGYVLRRVPVSAQPSCHARSTR